METQLPSASPHKLTVGSLFQSEIALWSRAFSQVVELLAERLDLDALLLDMGLLLRINAVAALLPCIVALLGHAYGHVEVGDLVRILAWCWHFDRSSPVEITVAEGVSQRLQLDLLET